MKRKLTLRLDDSLIEQAKEYSRKTGLSLSQIVADYFARLVTNPSDELPCITPNVRKLRGALKGADADRSLYREHLARKLRVSQNGPEVL